MIKTDSSVDKSTKRSRKGSMNPKLYSLKDIPKVNFKQEKKDQSDTESDIFGVTEKGID